MQPIHQPPTEAEFVPPLSIFPVQAPQLSGVMETVPVLLQYKHAQKSKNKPKGRTTAAAQSKSAHGTRRCARAFTRKHTQRHSATLTLAWLSFLDDRQLVVDEHRRAEVSLERPRLTDERREQNSFSFHYLFIDRATASMW